MAEPRSNIVSNEPVKPPRRRPPGLTGRLKRRGRDWLEVEVAAADAETVEVFSRPVVAGTIAFIAGLIITGSTMIEGTPVEVARFAGIGLGLSLISSVLFDLRYGFNNLFRADLMALAALFFLTLVEYFFPQEDFNMMAAGKPIGEAAKLCFWGFAGIVLGRHIILIKKDLFGPLFARPVSGTFLVRIFWGCFIAGYLYMFSASDYDPIFMVECFMGPRFSQPWSRGTFGDWKALLYEFSMLIFLIPPIAGVILARHKNYTNLQITGIAFGLLFTLFYGFSSGTRNLFASYLVTLLMGFFFAVPSQQRRKAYVLGGICVVLLYFSTKLMLEFRQMGLKNYMKGYVQRFIEDDEYEFAVDYNLNAIAGLYEVFPARYDYLGMEVPYWALVRPIPRAIWPGKPTGLSLGIEEALGARGLTVACTFVGEAYMSAGVLGIFLFGLFFGSAARTWEEMMGSKQSEYVILIYASGFFSIVISMRSMLSFTTALLPTVAALTAGYLFLPKPKPASKGGTDRRRRPMHRSRV